MINPSRIEDAYKDFMGSLPQSAHDGIIPIDLTFLHDSGLLEQVQADETNPSPNDLTQYFHVIESAEKVTLFNEQFVVWIVPRSELTIPTTYVLIALAQHEMPHLEIVFTTSGVYNTPRYVLKILQHFLNDMLETEESLHSMDEE